MHQSLALHLSRRVTTPSPVWTVSLVVAGSLFVAVCAQFALDLPFTPVPISGQTFAVLLVGATLGSRRGAASLALYMAEGAAGIPVFAHGTAGAYVMAGPTGGYIAGFVAAAWTIGKLSERGLDRRWHGAIVTFTFGTLLIYVFGALWLAHLVGFNAAIAKGVLPFLPGDLVKIVAASLLLPSAWKLVTWSERPSMAEDRHRHH